MIQLIVAICCCKCIVIQKQSRNGKEISIIFRPESVTGLVSNSNSNEAEVGGITAQRNLISFIPTGSLLSVH